MHKLCWHVTVTIVRCKIYFVLCKPRKYFLQRKFPDLQYFPCCNVVCLEEPNGEMLQTMRGRKCIAITNIGALHAVNKLTCWHSHQHPVPGVVIQWIIILLVATADTWRAVFRVVVQWVFFTLLFPTGATRRTVRGGRRAGVRGSVNCWRRNELAVSTIIFGHEVIGYKCLWSIWAIRLDICDVKSLFTWVEVDENFHPCVIPQWSALVIKLTSHVNWIRG